MAISLQKGQKVDLTKGNPGLTKIKVCLGWDTKKYDGGNDFDLDASAFMLGATGKVVDEKDFVYYNNPRHFSGAVVHSGDNRTGEGTGDDEVIEVEFSKIPTHVEKISFPITIFDANVRNQNFGMVNNAYVRVLDANTNQELLRYDLGEDYSVETALVVCDVYKNNNEWKFHAIGSGYHGGLDALCIDFGLQVS